MSRTLLSFALAAALLLPSARLRSQGQAPPPEPVSRIGLSAGMGVSYVAASDIVDLVNATPGALERIGAFRAGVEFFGAFSYPLSPSWMLKVEYAYLLASFNVDEQYGTAAYTLSAHLPTLFLEYVLLEKGLYNVTVGAGAGYHGGTLEESMPQLDDRFSAKGVGVALDLEANTAFGDHLYAYLGGNLRWEFMGDLVSAAGATPVTTGSGFQPALHFFGAGARLGMTYFF